MLTKGGGNSEMGLSARAAVVICTYVSWMRASPVFVICVCINSALLDILCSLHCIASIGHVSDELTRASCFATVFYRTATVGVSSIVSESTSANWGGGGQFCLVTQTKIPP